MHCQNCHAFVPDIAKVCGECGTKLDREAMFPCPSCGEDVPVTAKVCGQCGTRLTEAEMEKLETPEEKPIPEKTVQASVPATAKAEPKASQKTKQASTAKKKQKPAGGKGGEKKIPWWVWGAGAAVILAAVLMLTLPGNKPVSMVYFACDQQTVPLGNEIFVYYHWLAKEPRQVDAFFDAAVHYVSVNDVWYKIRLDGLDEMRYDANDGGYKRRYWMNIGSLDQPGWYRIRTVVDINEQVFDGWGWNGPGTSNPRIDVTCDVHVVE